MKGAVLAGGSATRFGGRPKGLERVGGERIVDRVLRTVQAAAGERPFVVANAPDADSWFPDYEIVKDIQPPDVVSERDTPAPGEVGSLGGLYTAVSRQTVPVAVVAWDMPFLPVDLLAALCELVQGHDVAVAASEGPLGVEPFCGVYGPGCVGPIRTSLANEDFRATAFHQEVDVAVLPLADTRRFGDPEMMFFNVNTSADLAKAEELWRQERE